MFSKSIAVAKYTLRENVSNKIFTGFIIFALLILGGINILREITIYEGVKVIKDIGLALIELFMLLITVFLSSTLIIKAHKEKSIYLILTKSITRKEYIFGIALGIFSVLGIYILLLSGVLTLVLWNEKFVFSEHYFLSILYIYYKLLILTSLGILFSIISDSYVTGNIFTFCVYIISHMTFELKMMKESLKTLFSKFIVESLHFILPKYYLLNYRDYIKDIQINNLVVLLYVLIYISLTLSLAMLIFEKRKL